MRHVAIEINILEILVDQTIRSDKFNPDDWSLEDILILRKIANFIEEGQNESKKSKLPSENLRH